MTAARRRCSKPFKVDKTAPATTATPSRPADANGWYNHDLSVDFEGSDTTFGPRVVCSRTRRTAGLTRADDGHRDLPRSGREHRPGEPAAEVRRDGAAGHEQDAPRPPDPNGWHNKPLTVTFAGSDTCPGSRPAASPTTAAPTRPTPPSPASAPTGPETKAPSVSFGPLKYDATKPQATSGALPTAERERLVQQRG